MYRSAVVGNVDIDGKRGVLVGPGGVWVNVMAGGVVEGRNE